MSCSCSVGDINISWRCTIKWKNYKLHVQKQPADILCEVNRALKNTNGSLWGRIHLFQIFFAKVTILYPVIMPKSRIGTTNSAVCVTHSSTHKWRLYLESTASARQREAKLVVAGRMGLCHGWCWDDDIRIHTHAVYLWPTILKTTATSTMNLEHYETFLPWYKTMML